MTFRMKRSWAPVISTADRVTPDTRSRLMANIKGADTAPELLLRAALSSKGERFTVHAKLSGRPDIAFMEERVAVFVHGCFWHGCRWHYRRPSSHRGYWDAKLRRNLARDLRNKEELTSDAWCVLVVWEHSIRKDPSGAADRVAAVLARRRGASPPISRRPRGANSAPSRPPSPKKPFKSPRT